jgi:hypothetical protein
MKENTIFGAPITMHRQGKLTDAIILEEILKKPGITISEIAHNLGWTNGKVDGSVNRLVSEGKISVKHCLKRGMLVKMTYPAELPRIPRNVIEITKEMIDYDSWKEKAIVYSLSRSTVGIARREVKEWNDRALFKESISLKKNGESIIIKLPEKLSDFYQLDNSDISLSTIEDLILVTIESILPVKLPAEYPEESKYAVTRYRMIIESERIEGVTSYNPLSAILSRTENRGIPLISEPVSTMPRKRPEEKIFSTASTSESCNKLIKIPIEAK